MRDEITKQLQLAVDAVQVTLDVATHEENKPENKYDTRGLEASYLARAQSERVLDLKEVKLLVDSVKIREFFADDKIAFTALVNLESSNKNLWVLLLPKGGGQSFQYKDIHVKVVTTESPLGEQLIGKMIDDSITVKGVEYEIISVI